MSNPVIVLGQIDEPPVIEENPPAAQSVQRDDSGLHLDRDKLKGLLGIQSEPQKSKEDLILDFWDKRGSDARIWSYGLNISNLYFQVEALINPATPEHFKINAIYTVSTVIGLILTYASTKFRRQSGNLLFVVYMMLIPRQIIRILDLEKTKGVLLTEEDLGFFVLMQSIGGYATMFIYFNVFQGGKIQVFCILLLAVLMFSCLIVSQYGL